MAAKPYRTGKIMTGLVPDIRILNGFPQFEANRDCYFLHLSVK
jgi:hypothetical protein